MALYVSLFVCLSVVAAAVEPRLAASWVIEMAVCLLWRRTRVSVCCVELHIHTPRVGMLPLSECSSTKRNAEALVVAVCCCGQSGFIAPAHQQVLLVSIFAALLLAGWPIGAILHRGHVLQESCTNCLG